MKPDRVPSQMAAFRHIVMEFGEVSQGRDESYPHDPDMQKYIPPSSRHQNPYSDTFGGIDMKAVFHSARITPFVPSYRRETFMALSRHKSDSYPHIPTWKNRV